MNHLPSPRLPGIGQIIFGALTLCGLMLANPIFAAETPATTAISSVARHTFTDAADFGFSTAASGRENQKALQSAVDKGGTITVSQPGTYKIAGTVLIGSNTTLVFGSQVVLKKVAEQGVFSHVLLNKGALTKTYDEHIAIEGLQISVNGVDTEASPVYGLIGHLAFFYVKDLRIDRFRCLDLARAQFAIHVCTFEDLIVDDVIIKGGKDGVHLGPGKHYIIRDGIFQTFDDAVALNAHDYASSNPELGWIEDGLVENCHDLNADKTTGFFCRILAGAWIDWRPGMEVQHSDTVISAGRVYRVQMKPDGRVFTSVTPPTHLTGKQTLDGITWGMVQTNVTYTAGVRNVLFRNIFLEKPRTAFSIHFDNDKYSRSYYPGASIPRQEQIRFDNVCVLHDAKMDFLSVGTPVNLVSFANCSFRNNRINFHGNKAMPDYFKTKLNLVGCVFNQPGKMDLVVNSVPNKQIVLKTSGSMQLADDFSAQVVPNGGTITVDSDLTGLRK